MEQLREENHKLTLKIDSLRLTHLTELDYLRDEFELKEEDLKKQIAKLREDARAREQLKNDKIQALGEELNIAREEVEAAQEQIEKLRTQVDILKNAKAAGACGSYSDYEGLKESNRMLKSQLLEKDELLQIQTEKIRALSIEVQEFRDHNRVLSEEVEGKDSIVKELHEQVKALEREKEEECAASQLEVLGLKEQLKQFIDAGAAGSGVGGAGAKGDGAAAAAARGNSLFSEVEERRLKVESELSRLQQLVKRLTEDKRLLQLELERGDYQSNRITTQIEQIQKSERELLEDIKKDKANALHLFDSYRDRLDKLREEYSRKLQQYKQDANSEPHSTELESVRRERDQVQWLNLQLEREINELKRDVKMNKHLKTKAEADLKILKAKYDFVKQQQNAQQPCQNSNNNNEDDTGGGGATPPPPCSPSSSSTPHQQRQKNANQYTPTIRKMSVTDPNTNECNTQ